MYAPGGMDRLGPLRGVHELVHDPEADDSEGEHDHRSPNVVHVRGRSREIDGGSERRRKRVRGLADEREDRDEQPARQLLQVLHFIFLF